MDVSFHLEGWHILTAALAIAFHAGAMWYKVSQIQVSLERIASDYDTRLRELEKGA